MQKVAAAVAELPGVRWGRRQMLAGALVDMYDSLPRIRGGLQAHQQFLQVLERLAESGLSQEDNCLYDDSTPLPPRRQSQRVPESVAAQGLGAAGRVSLAPSMWRRCVPSGLRCIYAAFARRHFCEHAPKKESK